MPVPRVRVEEVAQVLNGDGDRQKFVMVPIRAISPDREIYRTLMLQPSGILRADETRIGFHDEPAAERMCSSFLGNAVASAAEIVISPEYCIPWSVIRTGVVAGSLRPPLGALWVLGCESTSVEALGRIRAEIEQFGGQVQLFHEPFDPIQSKSKKFIDPLVYVFWARDLSGREVLCVLVQFKTEPCKDKEHLERTNLYLGTRIYRFTNEGHDQISLITLICSDAFVITPLVEEWGSHHLIFHIQLNLKPGQTDYAAYRRRLFSIGSKNPLEIQCLNWGNGVQWFSAGGNTESWGTLGRSGWYVPQGLFNEGDDSVIDELHRSGVYHNRVEKVWHAFYLNYGAHALLVRKQKIAVPGPQSIADLVPPQVLGRYCWDVDSNAWIDSVADDGFDVLVADYPNLVGHLPTMCNVSPLSVERSLELLDGPTGKPESWFQVCEMSSWKVGEEEAIRRITVHQEVDPRNPGVDFRVGRIARAETAMTLKTCGVNWLPELEDLAHGFKFTWTNENPHRNVSPDVGEKGPVTLVYLNENSPESRMESIHQHLRTVVQRVAFDAGIKNGMSGSSAGREADRALDRICVMARRGNEFHIFRPRAHASITRQSDVSPVAITGSGS